MIQMTHRKKGGETQFFKVVKEKNKYPTNAQSKARLDDSKEIYVGAVYLVLKRKTTDPVIMNFFANNTYTPFRTGLDRIRKQFA